MRRLYKIIAIIIFGVIFTFLIYYFTVNNNESVIALGDSIASGETAYNVDGLSYNDYLKENLFEHHKLSYYNNNFAKKNYKLSEMINDIKKNKKDEKYIKQLLHNATIITLAIGMDEIAKYSITDKITNDYIKNYISEYDDLVYMLREYNKEKIVLIGLYKANNIKDSELILLNTGIKNIADKYDAIFLEISELLKDKSYYLKENSFYFNYKAHHEIYEMLNCTIFTCQTD